MSLTIETLKMQDDIFSAGKPVHFLQKVQISNGTMIVTLPRQEIIKKRGPNVPVTGGLMVQPTKELSAAFKAVRKAVPVGTVFVTRTLAPAHKGSSRFYSCSDLYLLDNCPEDIKETFKTLYSDGYPQL